MPKPRNRQKRPEPNPLVRLELFVMRARRITEHPLMSEPHRDLMQALFDGERKLHVHVDRRTNEVIATEETVISAPEELMDSLAARTRPLLLTQEAVYFPDVLDALAELVDDEHLKKANQDRGIQWWRDQWRYMSDKTGPAQAWHVEVSDGAEITDRMIADRWLHSDLVHADPLEPVYNEISFEDRYRAGCEVMSRMCSVIRHFLELVQSLQEQGALQIPASAFETRVVLSSTERKQNVVARMAPPDADPGGNRSEWPIVNPSEWNIEEGQA